MSDYKESGVKRRDFRSVKDQPEKPGALRSKKTYKPILVLSRYKPEVFDKLIATEHWWISRERRESNNAWMKYSSFPKVKDAENAIRQWKTDPYWGNQYEYKIIDTRVPK
jgi:hypothetical protein